MRFTFFLILLSLFVFAQETKTTLEDVQKSFDSKLEKYFSHTNPLDFDAKKTLEIYKHTKKEYPLLTIKKERLKLLKMTSEASGFEIKDFNKKYKTNYSLENDSPYFIWGIAEKVSNKKYGEFTPELVFQLVMRGGHAYYEWVSAVEETYKNFKENKQVLFNTCNYITSGYGMGFCTRRTEIGFERDMLILIDKMLKNNHISEKALVLKLYKSAKEFYFKKANKEEVHGGSGRYTWLVSSYRQQTKTYLEFIKSVANKSFKVENISNFKSADKKLNKTYQKVISKLKKEPLESWMGAVYPSYEDIRTVQRSWISFRDNSIELLNSLNKDIKNEYWKTFLTIKREKELQEILKYEN